jgi:hypothetical protein
MVGEVKHFPWGVMNSLMKVSPYMLHRVEIALQLWRVTDIDCGFYSPLAPHAYESHFCQVHLALPNLDKKLITSIMKCNSSPLY